MIATFIAVYGVFMTPLDGTGQGLFGAMLSPGLVNGRIKLLAYDQFDPTKPALLEKTPVNRTAEIAARAYELYRSGPPAKHRIRTGWWLRKRTRNHPPEPAKAA